MTKCYHGTAIHKLPAFLCALHAHKLKQPGCMDGIYVTDTPERAWRYANAQATWEVDPHATTPGENAAIIELDVRGNVEFLRRPASHPSLDHAETIITSNDDYTVARVVMCPSSYEPSDCHLRGKHCRAVIDFCAAHGIACEIVSPLRA